MKLQIYEILDKLKEFTGDGSVTKKIEWLQANDSQTLRMILKHGFDPNVIYDLPEGDPPFRKNDKPIGYSDATLYSETRKLAYLWLAPYDNTLKPRVEAQAIEIAKQEQIREERQAQVTAALAEKTALDRDYEQAKTAHEQALSDLSTLERELERVRKAVETTRTTMAQARVRLNTIGQRAQVAAASVSEIDALLARYYVIHKNDTEQLERQPAASPNIQNVPSPPKMPRHKREMLFIELLESLHPRDADVLLATKNKKLAKSYGLTKDIIKKSFPDLL